MCWSCADYGFGCGTYDAAVTERWPRPRTVSQAGYYVDLRIHRPANSSHQHGCCLRAIRIHTYMDAPLQASASAVWRRAELSRVASARLSSAAVVVQITNGGVAALMGGRRTMLPGVHRAVRIRRQPARSSSHIGHRALESGYTRPRALDEQADFMGYRPGNAGRCYLGWVTMRRGRYHP